jgi:hypothetical protein
MMTVRRLSHSLYAPLILFLLAAALVSCAPSPPPPPQISSGSSKAEVIAAYGEPDEIQDFILPAEPFFGPQEGLADLVPPGTVLEEWVYEIDDQVLYVWFTGEPGEPREDWLVLEKGQYPKDAVY